jgi:hypothetical protein
VARVKVLSPLNDYSKFSCRCGQGLGSSDANERSPIFIQVCKNERSPIFIQACKKESIGTSIKGTTTGLRLTSVVDPKLFITVDPDPTFQ